MALLLLGNKTLAAEATASDDESSTIETQLVLICFWVNIVIFCIYAPIVSFVVCKLNFHLERVAIVTMLMFSITIAARTFNEAILSWGESWGDEKDMETFYGWF